MSTGLPSSRRRRHRPGGHADVARSCASARSRRAEIVPVRVRALGRPRARRVLDRAGPSPRSPSRALTSRCSRRAARPRASGLRASPRPGAVVIDNSCAGGCTRTCRSSSARSTPRRSTPPRDHREPELHDDADGRRAEAAPDAAGIERLVISTYQAVGTGKGRRGAARPVARAVHEREIARQRPTRIRSRSTPCPTLAASREGDDHTDEERKLINETRKILGDAVDPRSAPRRARAGRRPATPRPSTCRRAMRSRPSARASC